MLPVLVRVGPVSVGTHDAFVAAGVLAAILVYLHEARRREVLGEQLMWVALGALFFGAVAAKLSTGWRYLAGVEEPTVAGLWLYGGRSVLGGLAGAYVGAVLTKRLVGYRRSTGDLFAPAVALGMAIGRWGCFLTEGVGTPTSLPWGITLTPEQAVRIPACPHCVAGVPLHPSFLYEILFHAVAFGILVWMRPRVRVEGDLFKLYLAAYGLFRFWVEFVRGSEVAWLGLTRPQLFLVPSMAVLAIWYWRRTRSGRPVLGVAG